MQFIFTTVFNVFTTFCTFSPHPPLFSPHTPLFSPPTHNPARVLYSELTQAVLQALLKYSNSPPLHVPPRPAPSTLPNPARAAPPAPPHAPPAPAPPRSSRPVAAEQLMPLASSTSGFRTLSATSAASLRATGNVGMLRGGLQKCNENVTFFTPPASPLYIHHTSLYFHHNPLYFHHTPLYFHTPLCTPLYFHHTPLYFHHSDTPLFFTTPPLPVYVLKTGVRHRAPPEQLPLAPASSAYAVRQGRKRVEVERGGKGEREGRGGRGEREGFRV
jgi:hypothetical protein